MTKVKSKLKSLQCSAPGCKTIVENVGDNAVKVICWRCTGKSLEAFNLGKTED